MLKSLFVDMNAYFAPCEQHDRPELRGKPTILASSHAVRMTPRHRPRPDIGTLSHAE